MAKVVLMGNDDEVGRLRSVEVLVGDGLDGGGSVGVAERKGYEGAGMVGESSEGEGVSGGCDVEGGRLERGGDVPKAEAVGVAVDEEEKVRGGVAELLVAEDLLSAGVGEGEGGVKFDEVEVACCAVFAWLVGKCKGYGFGVGGGEGFFEDLVGGVGEGVLSGVGGKLYFES